MAQVARNLTDRVDGFLRDAKWLILDRDTKFTEQFRRMLDEAGVGVVTTAFQVPNMNAIAERFVGSIKRECPSKLILFGEDHLRCAIRGRAFGTVEVCAGRRGQTSPYPPTAFANAAAKAAAEAPCIGSGTSGAMPSISFVPSRRKRAQFGARTSNGAVVSAIQPPPST